jgi:3-oxoadipate enol-lactonase
VKVHHTIHGDGPRTLVLANALGTTTALWEGQIPTLSKSCRVVSFDIRGHGLTPLGDGVETVADVARDVLELLDDVGADRVSFAGISLGGCVGMWLAVTAPERVESLVLACTSATFGAPQAWIDRAAKVRSGGTQAIAEWSMPRWFTEGTRSGRPAAVERFHAALCEVSDEGYAGCCDALAAWDATDQLGEVAAPTLVIAGADDPATPPADVRVVADGIPGATMHVVPGAAHLANVDQPGIFTDLMLRHLSKEHVYER